MGSRSKLFLLVLLTPFFLWMQVETSHGTTPNDTIYTSGNICGECHAQIHGRWKNSMHALSVRDPIFDNAYNEAYRASAGKAKFLCLKCHSPTTYMTGDYDLKLQISMEGITCDFCHTTKSVDLNSEVFPYVSEPGDVKRGPLRLGEDEVQAHQTEFSPLHTSSSFCAGCHEYTNSEGTPILSTYSEWLASPYAEKGVQCQNCHMPLTQGPSLQKGKSPANRPINEHNLAGGHSIEQLKKAVKIQIVRAEREGEFLNVSVKITNVGSGHMVPTGLPTRKLVLRVEVKTADGEVLSRESKTYQKVLVNGEGKVISRDSEIWYAKKVLYDNRLLPLLEERSEEFTFQLPQKVDFYFVSATISYLYEPLILQKQKMELIMDSESMEIR
jgi:hypothetical protein